MPVDFIGGQGECVAKRRGAVEVRSGIGRWLPLLVAVSLTAGDVIDVHVYPGVYHEFDITAAADAHSQVAKFLDEHLK